MARYASRPATAEDLELAWRIKRAAFRPSIEATWGWDEQRQRELHEKRFLPGVWEILLGDGEPVGTLHVARKPDEIVLVSVFVAPAWQSKGIGTSILESLHEEAADRGVPIRLAVLRVNERARAFYERHGFRVYQSTKAHHLMRFDDPKGIVRRGYDAVSHAYRGDEQDEASLPYDEWLDLLVGHVRRGARVLDLGCGCGVPAARRLAADYEVTGVDISPVQIERARRLVPRAHFVCADMTSVELPVGAYAAVVTFYALVHVPRGEQPAVFEAIRRWLEPGGHLLATVGHRAWTGTESDWLGGGALMYWSHPDEATYLAWLREAGFEILWTRFVAEDESGHTLVLARRE